MSVLPAKAEFSEIDTDEWRQSLRASGPEGDEAVAGFHALLLRTARFEVARRRPGLPHLRGEELDDIALEAADDALVSVLLRLDDFRGDSRFSTWAYKFALLETAVKLRRRAWQTREIPLEPEGWNRLYGSDLEPDAEAAQRELPTAVETAVTETLTPHQRRVLVALALNEVPIDVLADSLGTSRGALYETLHDARCKLRRHLGEHGVTVA